MAGPLTPKGQAHMYTLILSVQHGVSDMSVVASLVQLVSL